jgi:hypothetical protein
VTRFWDFNDHGLKQLAEAVKVGNPKIRNDDDRLGIIGAMSYTRWCNDHRPYYSVYPSIIPILTRINLDIPASQIIPPLRNLLIRLPVENNPLDPVRTILITHFKFEDHDDISRLNIMVDYSTGHCNSVMLLNEQKISDVAKEWEGQDKRHGFPLEGPNAEILKLVSTLCLLANDPTLIEPDVLDKDRGRYEFGDEETKRFLEDRAKRRGKIGYLIGGYMERGEAGVIPHYRRPHLQLYHTGKGRTIPKIVNVRGCIVHREIVAKIPTGYEQ